MSKRKIRNFSPLSFSGSIITSDVDIKQIPFVEWSDAEVSAEKWDSPESKVKELNTGSPEERFYEDRQSVYLPPSLSMYAWKRASKLFPEHDIVIFKSKLENPHLLSANEHLLQSPFMRSFIGSIEMLSYMSQSNKFSFEFVSNSFHPPNENWAPWLHVYCKCKAGKGVQNHIPLVNNYGKYIVRLFWMGSWRKIYVDDLLPVNSSDQLMLPSLDTIQKGTLELWPLLLSKAMLKVAALTWYDDQELVDFDVIECLTGWIPNKVPLIGLTLEEKWDTCWKYPHHYQWENVNINASLTSAAVLPANLKGSNSNGDSIYSCAILCLEESSSKADGKIVMPWNHHVLLYQTRDIPLTIPTYPKDYPEWKRYRWLEWAAREGLISPIAPTYPIRSVKIVDAFRKTLPQLDEIATMDMVMEKRPTTIIPSEETEPSTDLWQSSVMMDQSMTSEQSRGTAKTKRGKKIKLSDEVKSKRSAAIMDESCSLWIDFDEIQAQLKYVTMYFKPSGFKSKIRVSNFPAEGYPKDNKYPYYRKFSDISTNWAEVSRPMALKIQRNEPLYLCTDSTSEKNIVFHLSRSGNIDLLFKETSIEFVEVTPKEQSHCELCLSSYLDRYKSQVCPHVRSVEEKVDSAFVPVYERVAAHLVIGRFDWRSEAQDDVTSSLRTYGTGSLLFRLKPGRYLFRLWLKCNDFYVLNILGDCPVVVGPVDLILTIISEESHSIHEFCSRVGNAFHALVISFGTPEYASSLREYCQSYLPPQPLSKKELITVHDAFYEELLRTVNEMGPAEAKALIILLKRWQIDAKPLWTIEELEFCYYLEEGDDALVEVLQAAAMKIQALFRGIYERSMMRLHLKNNSKFRNISEKLHGIDKSLSGTGRKVLAILFRNFLKIQSMEEIWRKYPFADDVYKVTELFEISQSTKVSSGWVIICRQMFFVSTNPVLIKVCFCCDLSVYVVRVFNNETKEEYKKFTNNVICNTYSPNSRGYTIVCYGRTATNQTINYRLCLFTDKIDAKHIQLVPTSQIKIESVSGVYLPVPSNLIFRYNLINKSDLMLSVRLTCSNAEAQVMLKILDPRGELVMESFSHGSAIIPVVILDCLDPAETFSSTLEFQRSDASSRVKHSIKKSKQKLKTQNLPSSKWIIEAYVMNNSWPLSLTEWKQVKKVREEMLYRSKKMERKSVVDKNSPPHWNLQVITNTEDYVNLCKDTKEDDDLMEMKNAWYSKKPNRYKVSQNLRQQYLKQALITNENQIKSPKVKDLKAEVFEENLLPAFHITNYAVPQKSDESSGSIQEKSDGTLFLETKQELETFEDFKLSLILLRKNMKSITSKQKSGLRRLSEYFRGFTEESAAMMKQAYAKRSAFYASIKEVKNK